VRRSTPRPERKAPPKGGAFRSGTWEITRATLSLRTPSSIIWTVASSDTGKLQHALLSKAMALVAEYIRRTTEVDQHVAQITVAQPTGQSKETGDDPPKARRGISGSKRISTWEHANHKRSSLDHMPAQGGFGPITSCLLGLPVSGPARDHRRHVNPSKGCKHGCPLTVNNILYISYPLLAQRPGNVYSNHILVTCA
jgi:hypothetical protein